MKYCNMIILYGYTQFQTSSFIIRLNFLNERNKSKILYALVNYFLSRRVYFN